MSWAEVWEGAGEVGKETVRGSDGLQTFHRTFRGTLGTISPALIPGNPRGPPRPPPPSDGDNTVAKPVILAVDDDPAVLGAIERDLRQHYRADYRVMKAGSAAEGLEAAQELAARNTPVALFLVDQRMPGMTGIELLREVMKLHPAARRVLLTAYADTDVAIAGINEIGLDHYLMKPWDPPEQRLYPVLDDLLSEWRARVRPAFEGIRVLGSQWSPQSFAIKEFLSRNRVPYEWVDLDHDATGARPRRVARRRPHPPAGGALPRRQPPRRADDGGAGVEGRDCRPRRSRPFYDVIVIGGGPAGLANAVYARVGGAAHRPRRIARARAARPAPAR